MGHRLRAVNHLGVQPATQVGYFAWKLEVMMMIIITGIRFLLPVFAATKAREATSRSGPRRPCGDRP